MKSGRKALVMGHHLEVPDKCCDETRVLGAILNTLLTSRTARGHWQGSNGRGLHGHAPHLASDLIRQRSLIHQRKRTPWKQGPHSRNIQAIHNDKSECRQVRNDCAEVQDEALAADSGNGKGKDGTETSARSNVTIATRPAITSLSAGKGSSKEGQGPRWGKAAKDDAAPAEEEREEMEAWVAMEEIPHPQKHPDRSSDAAAARSGMIPTQAEHGQPKP